MIEYIIIGLLSVICCVLGYVVRNLLNKVEVYEAWAELFRTEADQLHGRLKMVDEKNLFDKDDDVGFVFSEVLRIAKEFNDTVK